MFFFGDVFFFVVVQKANESFYGLQHRCFFCTAAALRYTEPQASPFRTTPPEGMGTHCLEM